MKFTTTLAYILYFLPLLVVLCAQEEQVDYDLPTCKASSPVLYRIKQAVPTTAQNLSNRADIGIIWQENTSEMTGPTVDIIIKRYSCVDRLDTSMTKDDRYPQMWMLNLKKRGRIITEGPLYVALYTPDKRSMVIAYTECQTGFRHYEGIKRDMTRPLKALELSRVWTHRDWRDKGIAAEMLSFALHDLASYTSTSHVGLIAAGDELIPFYEKAGFSYIGTGRKSILGIELRRADELTRRFSV